MSMTRIEAIKHFTARKYSGMTAFDAYSAAPTAVVRALDPKDTMLILDFHDHTIAAVVERLYRRSYSNPDGVKYDA